MKLIEKIRLTLAEDIGREIRRARMAEGLSIRELAEQIGVSSTTLAKAESGEAPQTVALCAAIAHALDTTLDALVPVVVSEPEEV